MDAINQKWEVAPENRKKFEKVVMSWGVLIRTLGWKDICEMYVRRTPPFQDVPELKGKNKTKQARQIIINTIAHEMKEAGLKVTFVP